MGIVVLMLEKRSINYNDVTVSVEKGGYIDIVELMLEKASAYYNGGIIRAILPNNMFRATCLSCLNQ